ncbi:hypothetical protein VPH35_005900 [Triticum aestivum]
MSPAVAPATAAAGPDPPTQHPEVEIITMRMATTDSSPAVVQASLVPASRKEEDDAPAVQRARDKDASHNRKADRELRGWLMVLATVIASITYASGLNPPGGFQGGGGQRVTPVLRATSPRRYTTFYYCNTTAFALSLSIMLLVASQDLGRLAKVKVLEIIVALDLGVCAGLVLIVPVALIVMSSRVYGKYFWDEL